MKSKHINIIIIAFLFLISNCDQIDVSGFFTSSNVEDRFSKRSSYKNFKPPVIADVNNFSFVVMTDLHYYKTQQGFFEEIEEKKSDWDVSFIVVTGDIVQNGKKDVYELVKKDINKTTLPVYPAIGNHDLYNNGFDNYKKYFGRTVYSITIGKTILVFLDTANGTLGEGQKAWLEKVLDESNAKNKILFTHYNPTDTEFESPTAMTYPEETYYIFDLCEKYNVNYFICGHLHEYDNKTIKGTNYIVLNKRANNINCLLKVSVVNGDLQYKMLK